MLINYHVHTKASPDGLGTIDEYCHAAVKAGIGAICFTDHQELLGPFKCWSRAESWYNRLDRIAIARKKHDLMINFGIEMGYYSEHEDTLKQFLQRIPFDYVLGSLHNFKEYDFTDSFSGWDREEIIDVYFTEMRKLISSGLFDSVGHFDLVKKAARLPFEDYKQDIEDCVGLMAVHNLAFELNTKGWRNSSSDCYPSFQILQIMREAGLRATLSTDAHRPDQIAYKLGQGIDTLRKAGFKEIYTFDKRVPAAIPI